MKNLRLPFGLALASALAAACGSSGSGNGTVTSSPTPTPTSTVTATPTPSPTATPLGPIYLTDVYTADGTPHESLGKCIGFTITANDAMGVYFDSGATATLGALGNVPVTFYDGRHLRVGDPNATEGKCFYTPFVDQIPGAYDLTVTSGSNTWTLPAAFTFDPPVIYDMGNLSRTRLWSTTTITDPGANVFERPYDVDIYKVNVTEAYNAYAHADFFNTGTVASLPSIVFFSNKFPTYLNEGGFASIFPEPGIDYFVVRDVLGMGSPEASYDMSFIGDELGSEAPSDTCNGAPYITPRGYHVNYDILTNNFDPQGNSGCLDSIYGRPIHAPGNDAVWKVTVPNGKELRVSTYDDHIDNVVYMLPMSAATTDTNGCPVMPTDCVAAAGFFGPGNNDTLIYDNKSGADEDFFLIHDSATVMTNSVGSFLINVELFDAR